ncbi:D-alanyl-D-alanine carboxypeptidase family protein [Lederbergia citrea]|uniref:serine-type D-Ala-D-Ala carboxypeptidase n=1 Tax=Lederbergia citrea TaxID=2833581 RepID=A0A942UP51_9BACI|nr:D-alanyl-D-alanine carboxypeptidase family protein [Lederbergia citrea]MBS4176464.1 D-alanyl-D-alanine carboxypeptidase [Lederbergia citrea]MBS4203025.1 D-alanyl-D-alanine carboxypeptidase [Lederbergia citrea]MBS4222303.1 D-alanyl-D-alanine carboxypeptidase [Lederbergia citrea]
MIAKRKIVFISLALTLLLAILLPKSTYAFSVSSSGAVLMEQNSGRVLYEKNPHEKRRIASITKIMTAIIAIESGKMNETVKVSKEAVYTEGSSIYLQPGERIKLEDLVYGLMLRSGNDAARAIAEHVGGSLEGFVYMMNQKAEELGMSNTVFANPHGLDDHKNHYSTPYDMALLTRYAMLNDTYRTISGTKVYKFSRDKGPQSWTNKNRLLTEKYKYCTGGKTGFTKRAGRTLVSTAARNGTELIAVTLDGSDDWDDHIAMYELGFNSYPIHTVMNEGPISINLKGTKNKNLYLKESIYYPLSKEEEDEVRIEYKLLQEEKLAKITEGQVGIAILYFHDEPIKRVPIYMEKIEKKETWWQKLQNLLFGQTGVMHND